MGDRIEGLGGVIVWTSAERFPAMRRFYVETLGLTPRSDRAGFVNFSWGTPPVDVRLTVSVHDQVHGTARDPLRVMLNLAVRDIEAVAARLRAAGVTFERPPEREAWGGAVATMRDPDGNVVQLLEPAGVRTEG
jgi:catechol 2,3-dioxygenase-like lactoylglutathione lyase family enzyme